MSVDPDSEFIVPGPQSFGSAIREFRLNKGISQAELAERADLHRSYLSSLENGQTTDAMRNVMRALSALDLEVVIRPVPHHEQPR